MTQICQNMSCIRRFFSFIIIIFLNSNCVKKHLLISRSAYGVLRVSATMVLKVAVTLIQDHSQVNEDFEANIISQIIQGFNMYQKRGSRELFKCYTHSHGDTVYYSPTYAFVRY